MLPIYERNQIPEQLRLHSVGMLKEVRRVPPVALQLAPNIFHEKNTWPLAAASAFAVDNMAVPGIATTVRRVFVTAVTLISPFGLLPPVAADDPDLDLCCNSNLLPLCPVHLVQKHLLHAAGLGVIVLQEEHQGQSTQITRRGMMSELCGGIPARRQRGGANGAFILQDLEQGRSVVDSKRCDDDGAPPVLLLLCRRARRVSVGQMVTGELEDTIVVVSACLSANACSTAVGSYRFNTHTHNSLTHT